MAASCWRWVAHDRDAPVHTTCPYCGVGCGVVAQPDETIKADAAHPANRGRLCSKGAALGATLDDSTRLTVPMVYGQAAGWDEALQTGRRPVPRRRSPSMGRTAWRSMSPASA